MFAAGVDRSLHTLDPIALARAFSEGGRGYISRARARDREIPVTVDTIATAVWGLAFIRDPAVRRELDDGAAEARRIRAEQPELIDGVLASAETIDAARDCGMNLRTLLAGEYVSAKSLGIAASLVAVYARQQQLRAERATLVPGFLAPTGAKVTDLGATVTVRLPHHRRPLRRQDPPGAPHRRQPADQVVRHRCARLRTRPAGADPARHRQGPRNVPRPGPDRRHPRQARTRRPRRPTRGTNHHTARPASARCPRRPPISRAHFCYDKKDMTCLR
ncbi:hypothetical protein [Rhodococcus sp. IEGM 1307]|uniref:hypothetical protein n=1 Tax=Rhodococcus sp. IEGM 1307 TaxID=3047091 RepID=UPI0024B7DF70|nr:hypothetical protein [Rhodococcus sp. IEGM 1307]MDI9973826.1 hypothetical protein [Rhodococcus sp. IEGM 1307]